MAKDSFVRAKPNFHAQDFGQSSQIPFSMFGRPAPGGISHERTIAPGSQTDEHAARPIPSRSSG